MMQNPNFEIPKISGALNNCALNCALPTLFTKIDQISKSTIHATESLKLFKRLFKEWYNIEKLSWHTFNSFISSQSFAENELIFAPILRAFLREKGAEKTLYELQDNGRYSPLYSDEANNYFYKYFDVFLDEYQFNGAAYNHLALELPLGSTPIKTYFHNEHFELQEHENIVHDQQTNSNLESIHEMITSHPSKDSTNQAFELLKTHVPYCLDQIQTPSISKTALENIVNAYQSDYYYLHLFLWVITLGFHKRASSSILTLQHLLQTDSEYFNQAEIATVLNHPNNHDSKKTNRYEFWVSDEVEQIEQPTGTDRVLIEIKRSFI